MEAAGAVGVVHLALHSDQRGLITRWKTRLKAYIDPGLPHQSLTLHNDVCSSLCHGAALHSLIVILLCVLCLLCLCCKGQLGM